MRILLALLVFLGFQSSFAAISQHSISPMIGAFNTNMSFIADQELDGNTTEDVDNAVALSGVFLIGGEYTYRATKSMGVSVLAKYQGTCDDTDKDGTETETCVSLITIGGLWRHFLRAGGTEFTMGAGLANVTPTVDGEVNNDTFEYDVASFFGTMFALGANYEMSESTTLGVEYLTTWALSDSVQGLVASDFLIKATFGL